MNYAIAQFTPIFRLTYLLYASPGLILLLSYIVSILKFHFVFRLLIIIFLLYPSFKIFTPYQYIYDNWKETVPKVKKLMDDKTVVLICDWAKHREFTYYYAPEIFADYDSIIPALRKSRIHAISDSNSLKTVVHKWADKIVYIRSHDNAGDPLNTNVAMLNNNHFRLCNKFSRDFLHVEIYLKDSIPCDSLKPVYIFPGENCDLWEKALASSFYNDTVIRYLNDMEKQADCKLLNNRVTHPVYSGQYAAIVIDTMEYCSPLVLPVQEIDSINTIDISLMAYMESLNDARIVFSIEEENNPVFRTTFDLRRSVKSINTWEKVNTTIKLPEQRGENTKLWVYLWNPGSSPVYIDNVELSFKYLPTEN